jgi:[ribosomal protein S5]-alanine N-acetyltransferase
MTYAFPLPNPILTTPRLILRAPEASDWPTFREYRTSARTVFAGGPKTPVQAAEQFASFIGHWALRGFGRLIAVDRATKAPLGHFGPMQWQDDGEIELTWSLWAKDAEGKGLAAEACRAMHAWVFGTVGVQTAIAPVHRDNAASHAIARHLGGTLIKGRRPEWFDEGSVYQFTPKVTA